MPLLLGVVHVIIVSINLINNCVLKMFLFYFIFIIIKLQHIFQYNTQANIPNITQFLNIIESKNVQNMILIRIARKLTMSYQDQSIINLVLGLQQSKRHVKCHECRWICLIFIVSILKEVFYLKTNKNWDKWHSKYTNY